VETPRVSTVGMPRIPLLMVREGAQQRVAAAGIQLRIVLRRPREHGIGPVTDPRSPGREPGDSGHDNHPAVHAA